MKKNFVTKSSEKSKTQKVLTGLIAVFLSLTLFSGCFVLFKNLDFSTPEIQQEDPNKKDWEDFSVDHLEGKGTENSPWEISSAEDLAFLSSSMKQLKKINADTNKFAVTKALSGVSVETIAADTEVMALATSDEAQETNFYTFTSDINLSNYRWNPIPALHGHLDGQGHTLNLGDRVFTDEDLVKEEYWTYDEENNKLNFVIAPFVGGDMGSSNINVDGTMLLQFSTDFPQWRLDGADHITGFIPTGDAYAICGFQWLLYSDAERDYSNEEVADYSKIIMKNVVVSVDITCSIIDNGLQALEDEVFIAGILYSCDGQMENCVYYGDITYNVSRDFETLCIAGVCWYKTGYGSLVDCVNLGNIYIKGARQAKHGIFDDTATVIGGVCGSVEVYQKSYPPAQYPISFDGNSLTETGAVIERCVNFGNLIVQDSLLYDIYFGGIVSQFLHSSSNRYYSGARVSDCVNYGDVNLNGLLEGSTIKAVGGVVGDLNILANSFYACKPGEYTYEKESYTIFERAGMLRCYNYGDVSWQITAYSEPDYNYGGNWGGGSRVNSLVGDVFEQGHIVESTTDYDYWFRLDDPGARVLGYYPWDAGGVNLSGKNYGQFNGPYFEYVDLFGGDGQFVNGRAHLFSPTAIEREDLLPREEYWLTREEAEIEPDKSLQQSLNSQEKLAYNCVDRPFLTFRGNDGQADQLPRAIVSMINDKYLQSRFDNVPFILPITVLAPIKLKYSVNSLDTIDEWETVSISCIDKINESSDPTLFNAYDDDKGIFYSIHGSVVSIEFKTWINIVENENFRYKYEFYDINLDLSDNIRVGNESRGCLTGSMYGTGTPFFSFSNVDDVHSLTYRTIDYKDEYADGCNKRGSSHIYATIVLVASRITRMVEFAPGSNVIFTLNKAGETSLKRYAPGASELKNFVAFAQWKTVRSDNDLMGSSMTGSFIEDNDWVVTVRPQPGYAVSYVNFNGLTFYNGTSRNNRSASVIINDELGIDTPLWFDVDESDGALKWSDYFDMNLSRRNDVWLGEVVLKLKVPRDFNLMNALRSIEIGFKQISYEVNFYCKKAPNSDFSGAADDLIPYAPGDEPYAWTQSLSERYYLTPLASANNFDFSSNGYLAYIAYFHNGEFDGRSVTEFELVEGETFNKMSSMPDYSNYGTITWSDLVGTFVTDITTDQIDLVFIKVPRRTFLTVDWTYNEWNHLEEFLSGDYVGTAEFFRSHDNSSLNANCWADANVSDLSIRIASGTERANAYDCFVYGAAVNYLREDDTIDLQKVVDDIYITNATSNANDFFKILAKGTLARDYLYEENYKQVNFDVQFELRTYTLRGDTIIVNGTGGNVRLAYYTSKNLRVPNAPTPEINTTVMSNANNPIEVYYNAPVILIAEDNEKSPNFAGYYAVVGGNEYLLSTNKEYNFFFEDIMALVSKLYDASSNKDDLHIRAKYGSKAGETEGSVGTQPSKEEGVWQIRNFAELLWVSNQVNSGERTFAGETIKLVSDIDMLNIGFTPIGKDDKNSFQGVFDGQFFHINNLFVANSMDARNCYGLFGYIKNATIKNLIIQSCNIAGAGNVGGLVGYAKNSIIRRVEIYGNTDTVNIGGEDVAFFDIYTNVVDHLIFFNSTGSSSGFPTSINTTMLDGGYIPSYSEEEFDSSGGRSGVVGGLVGTSEGVTMVGCSNRGGVNGGGLIGNSLSDTTIDQSFCTSADNLCGEGVATITNSYYGNDIAATYGMSLSGEGIWSSEATLSENSKVWTVMNGHLALKIFYWDA